MATRGERFRVHVEIVQDRDRQPLKSCALREGGRERTVSLHAGDIFVVPGGTEHKPSSSGGSILMFEPSTTLSTGDRHEGEIPAHVDSTTGHDIAGGPAPPRRRRPFPC
jgi:hypothetical protein